MSRIIVKNLPAKANESDVRKHFESKGRITDVKVMRKRDGSSRRFAFVGFTSDEEASEAANYFNMSFMLSSRLDVSLAKALGDESLERHKQNLKRKRLDQREEAEKANQKQKKPEPSKKDEKFDEFLSVMQPQKSTAMWKNDSTEHSARPSIAPRVEKDDEEEGIVDLNELRNNRAETTDDVEQQADAGEDENMNQMVENNDPKDEIQEEEPDWVPQVTEEEPEQTDNTQMSDMEWLRQRQTRIKENGDKPETSNKANVAESEVDDIMKDDESNDDQEGGNGTLNGDQDMEADASGVAQQASNRLFLRNLAFTVTRADLETLFGPFGVLKQIHLPIDPRTDKPKGIAFVEFQDVDEAVSAHDQLDGKSFQGRLLHIIFAEEQRGYQLDEFDIKNMPLKKQRALKRRMQASKQQFSWNSLYMNKDTVLEATASKLGLTKSQIMDPMSSNMAVKQALAESSVLESVQSYFRSKGVDLVKFQAGKSQELSDTVILAKNLPFQTSSVELQDMFAAYGEVVRTLMPPDGGIAIIQFKLASAGRAAFNKLAFRRVGDSVLYLQKAPKGVLDESTVSAPETDVGAGEKDTTSSKQVTSASDMLLPDDSNASAASDADVRTSVFIKNLNFSTTVASLSKLFQALPGFVTAVIKQKPDAHNPGRQLSMGFGFAEFRTLSQAETAVKALQGKDLDGHSLQLKISNRGSSEGKSSKAAVTAKIVIKNIPFETSKKDVVDLFGTFGKLRSVRVPRKFNRQTRGFAFAEFATPKEAEHAMSSLQGAHLLGRRLVMDYAQADAEDPETEIARMEAKVAQQVSAEDIHGRRLGGQQKGFDMENMDD